VRKNGGEQGAALAWNAKGTMLAFAAEDGDAGLLEFYLFLGRRTTCKP
jgi:hypothetical protein